MSKKVKVLVSTLVVIILLTAGGTTMAMAQEEETTPAPQTGVISPFLARVAEILGISTDNLTNAFEQARQEMREERLNQATGNETICQECGERIGERLLKRQQVQQKLREKVLEKAMGKQRITEDEAGEIRGWWGSRPEALDRVVPRARVFKAMRGRQMIAVPKGWQGQIPYQPAE